MREDMFLATPFQLSSSNEFDFATFLKCKPYLALKDECIIALIVQKILEILEPNQKDIRLLDVGSGDATVIGEVCRQVYSSVYLDKSSEFRLYVDCVEPSPEGIEFLRRMAAKVAAQEILVKPQQTTVEDFLINRRAQYDAIVCCHALYHIEYKKWRYILQKLASTLRPGGVLLVNLVSHRSDIYRIKHDLEKTQSFRNLPRMHNQYGFEYYAETLENVLSQLGDVWGQEIISADIWFSRKDVYQAIKELQGKGDSSLLLHFLAFMFRLRHNDLLEIGKTKLLELLIPNLEGITFKSIDKMFMFWRTADEQKDPD